jgi:YidC/Oxa1 family membrane protein insertase
VQSAYQAKYAATHHVSATVAASHTTACGAGHGASFLFIPDLTGSAHGVVLIVLILLYVGTQLGSTLLMSAPTMDKTQRQLMMAMPLFFVFFILSFPAGVIVYWITTNTWTILQQYFVRRRLGPMTPAVATAGPTSGTTTTPVGSGSGTSSGSGSSSRKKPSTTSPETNGSGGIAGKLRSRIKPEEPAAVAPSARDRRGGTPPPPPRKKKKRSGRRR